MILKSLDHVNHKRLLGEIRNERGSKERLKIWEKPGSVGSLVLQWTYMPTLNIITHLWPLHVVVHLFLAHLLPSCHLSVEVHKRNQLDSCWLRQPLHDTFQDPGQRFDQTCSSALIQSKFRPWCSWITWSDLSLLNNSSCVDNGP